ncbi:MAG TPA: hypothetical protein VK797_19510 [Tepidisphaeraceae bacterium]|jgi:hypothetical protein|nr:hypothetical protein [Tepidisphaeraceae bacterium]
MGSVLLSRLGFALGVCVVCASRALGGTITYDFNDGTLEGLVPSQTAGYSYNVSGGVLNVNAAAGTGNGGADFKSPLTITGDFSATVDATRTNLAVGGNMVISMLQSGGAFIDVYENGPNNIFSNTEPARGLFNSASDSSLTELLRIDRSGNTVTTSFSNDGGNTFQTLISTTLASFGGPVQLGIFMDQEAGNTAAQSGSFDNFTITSPSITPLPSGAWGGLVLLCGIGLTAAMRRNAGIL